MRQDYLRARLEVDREGALVADTFEVQDSSMLALFAASDCLVIRPPKAPAAEAGDLVDVMLLPPGF